MLPLEKTFSLEECLALEKIKDQRYEFLNDTVVAMAGGTPPHNQIIRNLIRLLEQGCQLLSSEDKLYTPDCGQKGGYVYPDVHIYCETPLKAKRLSKGNTAFTNPSIIIEVLCEDTRLRDKVEKYECYRKMESLQKYIMIESTEIAIFERSRMEKDRFVEDYYSDSALEAVLDIVGCSFSVKKAYQNYKFKIGYE